MADNRLDEAERYFAERYVRIDRRSGVSAPDASGRRPFLEAWRGFYDVGFEAQGNEFLAVRGERLHLVRSAFRTDDGREIVFLQVAEFDESGRAIIGINFDEEDLAAAIEELDARYVASGEASAAEADALDAIAAMNRRDWQALTAYLSPDLVTIDHSPLGFPPAGRDEFVREQLQGLVAMVPDAVVIPVKALASGDGVLTVFHTIGTTADGNRYEWTPVQVAHRGADGLTDRLEFFPVEEWDAALARFDELASVPAAPAVPAAPSIENAATRALRSWSAAPPPVTPTACELLMAPGFEASDRRSVIAGPTTTRRRLRQRRAWRRSTCSTRSSSDEVAGDPWRAARASLGLGS